jgi:hypothetical protein
MAIVKVTGRKTKKLKTRNEMGNGSEKCDELEEFNI